MTLQLPGCSSFGELETMSMRQKYVSRSMSPIWIAICTKRKLGSFKNCCMPWGYLTVWKAKVKPPELSILWVCRTVLPPKSRALWLPVQPHIARRGSVLWSKPTPSVWCVSLALCSRSLGRSVATNCSSSPCRGPALTMSPSALACASSVPC